MAFVLNFVVQSIEDFVLLAEEIPIRATLSLFVISTLAFSNVWARWIVRLQQSALLNFTSISGSQDPIDPAYLGHGGFNIDHNRSDAGSNFDGTGTHNTSKANTKLSTGIQGDNNGVKGPLKSSVTIQQSYYNLENNNTQSERGRAEYPSTPGRAPNPPLRDQHTAKGFPTGAYNVPNRTNWNGHVVIGLTPGTHRDVSFYPSTRPNGRSKSLPPPL